MLTLVLSLCHIKVARSFARNVLVMGVTAINLPYMLLVFLEGTVNLLFESSRSIPFTRIHNGLCVRESTINHSGGAVRVAITVVLKQGVRRALGDHAPPETHADWSSALR